jgi:hypothetical protein
MAYHYMFVREDSTQRRSFNIDWPVGRAATNAQDDVMLVQTLLHIVYFEQLPHIDAPMIRPAAPEIEVTGICDSTTRAYIMQFKQYLVKTGIPIYLDEVLDPFRDNDFFKKSTITRTVYAFARLVLRAARLNPPRFDTITENPATPLVLRKALRQTRKNALKYMQPAPVVVPGAGGW